MRQAIILAAGEGRRLRPFIVTKPKSMLQIAGKPIIRYVIEALAENGLRDIILIVGYRKEHLYDYIGDGSRNVVINSFSEVRNCVIGNDVYIGSNATLHDSVIDKGCIVGSHFSSYSEDTEIIINSESHFVKVGSMLGEGCKFGHGVVAQPGAIVGNYSQIKSLKVISGTLPDKSLVV